MVIQGLRIEPADLRDPLVELLDEMARLRVRFELVLDQVERLDQLLLEDAMDALERIEDFAAKQVDAAIDRMQG